MKTNVLSKIKTSLYEVVRHYPIELLLGVTFFVIYYRCVADNKESVFNVLLLFPVFLCLHIHYIVWPMENIGGYIGCRISFLSRSFCRPATILSMGIWIYQHSGFLFIVGSIWQVDR